MTVSHIVNPPWSTSKSHVHGPGLLCWLPGCMGCMQAVSPHHAISAFTGPGGFESGWRLLAGVMLAVTGAEAMYADLGHFNARAVTVSC